MAEKGSSSDEEPLTVIDSRPKDLAYQKTRVVAGRHYIDTSDESSAAAGADSRPESREGMVAFVAADIQERLRMKSPPQSGGTNTSESGSPSPYPPLAPDPQILLDLEASARQVGAQLDRVLTEFNVLNSYYSRRLKVSDVLIAKHGTLRGMTDLTVETMSVYTGCIGDTCDAVDSSIKSLYQLLAKYEELSRSLAGVGKMAQQVREIKRVLDLFEAQLLQLPPPTSLS